MQDGSEWIFVGDVAWHRDNIETRRTRPMLVSRIMMGEDRKAVAHQLGALHALMESSVRLRLIVAHDREQLEDYTARGLIGLGFE
jgi:hypothetical protein